MASIQKRGDRWQIRVVNKLLAKPFFATFDDETDARSYAAQLEAMLARGLVPVELTQQQGKVHDPLLIELIRDYTRSAPVAPSDSQVLDVLLDEIKGIRISGVTFQWVDEYVRFLKLDPSKHLAPGTIRKRVESLARVVDWHLRQVTPVRGHVPANPLRLLPKGYSAYSEAEGQLVTPKRDQVRDRRLTPEEDARVQQALAGHKRPDRERGLEVDPDFTFFYQLICDTGLRLREAYRLRVDQIDLRSNIIRVDGTKGRGGVIKPRVVPIKVHLRQPLAERCKNRVGLLFDFWDGSPETLTLITTRLSARFASLFDYAQVPAMREHDLRHEACCRWIEMRRPDGAWIFSEIEVCKIMGWSDLKMMMRYASLRGEDLSARLG